MSLPTPTLHTACLRLRPFDDADANVVPRWTTASTMQRGPRLRAGGPGRLKTAQTEPARSPGRVGSSHLPVPLPTGDSGRWLLRGGSDVRHAERIRSPVPGFFFGPAVHPGITPCGPDADQRISGRTHEDCRLHTWTRLDAGERHTSYPPLWTPIRGFGVRVLAAHLWVRRLLGSSSVRERGKWRRSARRGLVSPCREHHDATRVAAPVDTHHGWCSSGAAAAPVLAVPHGCAGRTGPGVLATARGPYRLELPPGAAAGAGNCAAAATAATSTRSPPGTTPRPCCAWRRRSRRGRRGGWAALLPHRARRASGLSRHALHAPRHDRSALWPGRGHRP
jgi:hypothetical protein